MTFSIVARSADGRHFGVAVASKFLAVGSLVPAAAVGRDARPGGALATQAMANVGYKARGLELLAGGRTAKETVEALTSADELSAQRQLGVVDAEGRAATFTGAECMTWAGGATGYGYAIQGNILAGSRVVAMMEEAWLASDQRGPLARRLLAALAAGDAAGGDSRGKQSAAVLVVGAGEGYDDSDVLVDLRVDDHEEPVAELRRLLGLHELIFGRPDPEALLELDGDLAAEVSRRLSGQGFFGEVGKALEDWAGRENLEMRMVPGRIDPVVLNYLRDASGGPSEG